MGEFECNGDTIFDDKKQFCDWPANVQCVDKMVTCPPTREPSSDPPTMPIASCPNPCPLGFTGFQTRPGSACKQYVQCDKGEVVTELECFGETIFNARNGYCDWPYSYSCLRETCPDRRPTQAPIATIAKAPETPTSSNFLDSTVSDIVVESADCPNPCPVSFNGFTTVPGTDCKNYVLCQDGDVKGDLECFGDTIFNANDQLCGWPISTRCQAATCPLKYAPVTSPVIEVNTLVDCPNPCPRGYSGFQTRPGTGCQLFVECKDGEVVEEFVCYANNFFVKPSRNCLNIGVMEPGWSCPQESCPTPSPTTANPISATTAPEPTTPQPSSRPVISVPTYQQFSDFLVEKEDVIKSIVLQSNGKPSTAYTFPDFINSMDIAVYQFPADKAFFVGEGLDGRLPKLSGMEYGLVNVGLFLSHAMQEGIRIDSCDEWNTDFRDNLNGKYPLSNACGEYGRSYEDEECHKTEPLHCALDKTMVITAAEGNVDVGAPPFTCGPRMYDGAYEVFPGYYDAVDGRVIPSAYSNTLGRTDVEGCCYWGRGVMLTRGRCTIGKLDKYIGQGAVDRGIYVYEDINFCANPEVVCAHERTNELRWVLGMLEWCDRVQSYYDLNTGWDYLDQLKKFVDGGMIDDKFIDAVINIVTRKCHDDSCDDQWRLEEENNVSPGSRRNNFRKIIDEVFSLPLTYHPTISPNLPPTLSPTVTPSVSQQPTPHSAQASIITNKPTQRKKIKGVKVGILPLSPNTAQCLRTCGRFPILLALLVPTLFLWSV